MPPEQDHPRHDPVGKVDGIRATSKEKEAPNDIATTPPLEEIRETLTRKLHSLETLLNDNTSLQDGLNSLDRDRFIKRISEQFLHRWMVGRGSNSADCLFIGGKYVLTPHTSFKTHIFPTLWGLDLWLLFKMSLITHSLFTS